MPAENLNITCPMCGGENRFTPEEIHQEIEPGDRLSDDTVVAQYCQCHECGERIDVELSAANSKGSSTEAVIAFLAIAGMGVLFFIGLILNL